MSSLRVNTGFQYEWSTRSWILILKDEHAFILIGPWLILVTIGGYLLWKIFCHLIIYTFVRWPQTRSSWMNDQLASSLFRSEKSPWKVCYLLLSEAATNPNRIYRKYTWWLLLTVSVLLGPGILVVSLAVPWWLTYGTLEIPTVQALPYAENSAVWVPNSTANAVALWQYENFNTNVTLAADNIFSTCYEKSFSTRCVSDLVSQKLPYTVITTPMSCPFGDVCATDPANDLFNPFRIETPPIQLPALGINADADMWFEKATVCAPISAKLFCTNCDSDDPYIDFLFGDSAVYAYRFHFNSTTALGYRLSAFTQDMSGRYKMDARLTSPDGVTTLVVLENIGINYLERNQDPIFYADKPVQFSLAFNTTLYQAKHFVTILGCQDMVRYGNHRTGAVTSWTPPEILQNDPQVFNSLTTQKIGLILRWAVSLLSTYNIIAGRGISSLRVTQTLSGYTQTQMSPNPTIAEASAWFGVGLAKLQLLILNLGTGDPNFNRTGFVDLLAQEKAKDFRNLGGMILFKDGDYTRISAWGLISMPIIDIVLLVLALVICKCLRIPSQHPYLPMHNPPIFQNLLPATSPSTGAPTTPQSQLTSQPLQFQNHQQFLAHPNPTLQLQNYQPLPLPSQTQHQFQAQSNQPLPSPTTPHVAFGQQYGPQQSDMGQPYTYQTSHIANQSS